MIYFHICKLSYLLDSGIEHTDKGNCSDLYSCMRGVKSLAVENLD